jgi:hypothetical protein
MLKITLFTYLAKNLLNPFLHMLPLFNNSEGINFISREIESASIALQLLHHHIFLLQVQLFIEISSTKNS